MRISLLTILLLPSLICIAQNSQDTLHIDQSLAEKITIAGFCLCKSSLEDLKKVGGELTPINVEEMDYPKDCFTQDSRYIHGKGYTSTVFPGLIFQKDQSYEFISKIRLTKTFKGSLPDGKTIDVKKLQLKDVMKMYPNLNEKWGSRECSTFWSFSNDTISFFVKIDPAKTPKFPIDINYYLDKPIEGIDLTLSCFSLYEKQNNRYQQVGNDPIFFVDSVNVTRFDLQKYQKADIAIRSVYKDAEAIRLVGPQGQFGAVYYTTKNYAVLKYWKFFKSKSADYAKIAEDMKAEAQIVYILNGRVLVNDFEGELSGVDQSNLINLKVIDKSQLKKLYKVETKKYGVVINAKMN
jgi:hypothetical protein